MAWRSILLVIALYSCVDRVYFDIGQGPVLGISVSGYISNQPGPYTVQIFSAFDIESKAVRKTSVLAKRVELYDNVGNSEVLENVDDGIYQTNPLGIRGEIGRAYKIQIELLDGTTYESAFDTISGGGQVDSIYFKYWKRSDQAGGFDYFMDCFLDGSYQHSSNRVMWRHKTTYKSETKPHLSNRQNCFWLDGKCNFVPPCSGYRNLGTNLFPVIEQVYPCTCCTCWYDIYHDRPVLNENSFSTATESTGIYVGTVHLDEWTLQFKMIVEVNQLLLGQRAFSFWKSILDQRTGIDDIFQPVAGRIPSNLTQISGPARPIYGFFYSASVSKKVAHLTRYDLPNEFIYAIPDSAAFYDDCRLRAAHSTATRPRDWVD